MVYQINPKIITLSEYGIDNFWSELNRIKEENNIYDQRNISWFDYLPETFMQYPEWFFLYDNNKPVAFSTIQKYYDNCYRILTRTYIYRDYRRFVQPKNDIIFSPSQHLALAQINYLKDWETIFVSMQGLKRRNTIERFKVKIEHRSGLKWELPDAMFQTCMPVYDPECYQNIIYNGETPKLKYMSIETYRTLHG